MTAKAKLAPAQALAVHIALGWSVYVTVMGVYWTTGGAGYPFGHGDLRAPESMSVLGSMGFSAGGPAIAATGVIGLVLLRTLQRCQPRAVGQRTAMVLAGGGFACVLVAVVLDGRALMLLPPFGLTVVTWLEVDWPTVFQMTVPVASAGFMVATVSMARRTADRSPAGRARAAAASASWDRVGRVATYVAMLAPLPYAIIRLCWSRGWAVGAPEPFVEWLLLTQPENVWIEPILAGMALTGVLLTSGLLCRWGRVFPSWMPGLSGRRVPLWLPLGLGGSAAMAVWSFGRGMLLGRLGVDLPGQVSENQAWGMSVSGWDYWGVDGLAWVLFPVWGISLGVALIGYYHRRGSPLPGAAAAESAELRMPLPEATP